MVHHDMRHFIFKRFDPGMPYLPVMRAIERVVPVLVSGHCLGETGRTKNVTPNSHARIAYAAKRLRDLTRIGKAIPRIPVPLYGSHPNTPNT